MENIRFEKLTNLFKQLDESLKFNIAEIGAHPYSEKEEPFYKLIEKFPNSKVFAFEVDKKECEKLNKDARKGVKFYPVALGNKNEKRLFYQTNHPQCSSLYEPNEEYLKMFNRLEVAILKNTIKVDTMTLDSFCQTENIENIDFIKIDIQGAELDVFEGAISTLKNTLAIISEVEFVELYKNQPLFEDVTKFLKKSGINFHKFINISGRTMKPLILQNNELHATQHMWADTMFIKKIENIKNLESSQLLKLSLISSIYGSPDLSFYCLKIFDNKNKTNSLNEFKKIWL